MKKVFLLAILHCIWANTALALEIVYPKTNNVKINAKSTFFIGNADTSKELTINSKQVEMVENGGFAMAVPLDIGENVFEIKSGDEVLIYKITRTKPQNTYNKAILEAFDKEKIYTTIKDGATLRATPINDGLNRLSQLPKDINLIIIGQMGDFYKVKLNDIESAWILKSEVSQCNDGQKPCVELNGAKCQKNGDFLTFLFKINHKTPFFIINKDEKVILRFFYTKDDKIFEFESKYGYDYYYDECGNFVLRIRKKIPKKPIITIDAGHGGCELGAIGCLGNKEKDINLDIAKFLKSELEKDFKVLMTREDDRQVSLSDRVEFARKNNSTILISIHSNALPDEEDPLKHRGTSVYYYNEQAKELAENILKEVTTQAGTDNDRVRQRSFALVRPTFAISVLVEVAYMINPHDNTMLMDCKFQKQVAKAIADALRNYLTN